MRWSTAVILLAVVSLPNAGCGYSSARNEEQPVYIHAQPAMQRDGAAPRFGESTTGPDARPAPRTPAVTLPAAPLPRVDLRASNPLAERTVAEIAVDSLGRIGPAAVPELVAALTDRDAKVRARAGQALARIGPAAAQAVPALVEALNDSDEDVRWHATRALGQIGPAAAPAVPALMRQMRDRAR